MQRLARLALFVVAVLVPPVGTDAETPFESGRRAYATMQAGAEYCPDIEETWVAAATIKEVFGYGYAAFTDNPAEWRRLQAQKDKLFEAFRSVPRLMVCEYLMQQFGPGGRLHLFQFR